MSPRAFIVLCILLTTTPVLLSSTAMMEYWRRANCHYTGSFESGLNDAHTGHAMKVEFSSPCRAEIRGEVDRGYRDGYKEGMAGRAALDRDWPFGH